MKKIIQKLATFGFCKISDTAVFNLNLMSRYANRIFSKHILSNHFIIITNVARKKLSGEKKGNERYEVGVINGGKKKKVSLYLNDSRQRDWDEMQKNTTSYNIYSLISYFIINRFSIIFSS